MSSVNARDVSVNDDCYSLTRFLSACFYEDWGSV